MYVSVKLFKFNLLPCIFYRSDDVTYSNETLGLKQFKIILCYGFVQISYGICWTILFLPCDDFVLCCYGCLVVSTNVA